VAVKLRLMRMGKKKQPTYRVVAADSRSPRNGRFIENIGTYDPRQDPSLIIIDNDRATHWLSVGAQPTERVAKLLKISGAWEQHTGVAPAPVVTVAGSATVTEEAVVEEAPAEEAVVEEAAAEEAVVEEAPAEEAVAEEAPAEAVEEAAAEEAVVEEAVAEEAPAEAVEEAADETVEDES